MVNMHMVCIYVDGIHIDARADHGILHPVYVQTTHDNMYTDAMPFLTFPTYHTTSYHVASRHVTLHSCITAHNQINI